MKSTDKFVLVLVASLALLLAGCGGGSSTPPPADVPSAAQMAIDEAKAELMAAEAGLSGANTDEAMAAAYRAIENAANALVAALTAHGGTSAEIAAAARTGGNAKAMADSLDMKIAGARKEADMAMAATAAKLYAGISAPSGDGSGTNDRFAAYSGTNDSQISVTFGDGTNAGTAIPLSEDKKTMVAANHGWAGKRYADPAGGDMVEAVVYSNVGDPTPGAKFNSGTGDGNVGFATTDGVLTFAADQNTATRIASPSFDHSAGSKTFKLPDPNTNGATMVTIAGSYYGVAGTYTCTPGATGSCNVNRAADGYTLDLTSATSWTFTATNPDARVTATPDAIYASYGWWIHKSADGSTFTASAFADVKGAVNAAATVNTLQGTATYSGGAAGKYALSSSTGGTNDAGHFTADATLQADFGDASAGGTITGTIDNFMGADGMSRDWSVELKENMIADDGLINSTAAVGGTGAETAWTIGGTAASASGEWSGTLYDNGDDGVPKVGTGTFYTTYGMGGKMVGAFGVNKQ